MTIAERSMQRTRLQTQMTSLEAQLQSLLTAEGSALDSEVVSELCKPLDRSLQEHLGGVLEHLQRTKTELACAADAVDSATVPSLSAQLLDLLAVVEHEVDQWCESYVKLLESYVNLFEERANTVHRLERTMEGTAWHNVNRLLVDNLRAFLEHKQQMVTRWHAVVVTSAQAYGSWSKMASDAQPTSCAAAASP